ncbi:zinc knuckle [Colletotrichum plurivorum]|uniref:Zinc knuckle n=1 Tax=Colletotrichum plurivorum TaxID=2175906 RepID=A0A8H6KFM9_9PEZI|nr:zinc knuckle [Colletotrichum plurivorum]
MTNLAPETPPGRGISSRLLTMKFMQRAAATGSPAEPSPEEPSSKRRKFQNSPLTGDFHSFDQAAVQAALKAQEAKRLSALEKSRAELADTHWVLDGAAGGSNNGGASARPNIVYVGYAEIDGAAGSDESETAQPVGRKRIGNFGSKNAKKPGAAEDDSDSGSSSDSDESSEDGGPSSGGNDTPSSKSKSKKGEGLSSAGQGRTRVNLKPQKSAESVKAREFRDKRKKKEVKLNQLSSISGAGGFSSPGAGKPQAAFTCHNCGKAGHKIAECPKQLKDGKRKSFQRS